MPDHSFVMFRSDGDTLVPTPMTAGPWIAGALSGAALAPLMASLVEDTPTPCPMLTTRLGIEFLRPVPMAPLRAERIVVREGRKQQLLRVILRAAGREVAAATAVRLRVDPAEPLDVRSPVAAFTPPEGPPFRPAIGKHSALMPAFDSRVLRSAETGTGAGTETGTGTGEAWLRYRGTIIDQQPLTPFVRAALFSDFGNGLAPILDPAEYSFLNADITLHLARLPVDEWLHLSCRTLDGGHGLGMVHTALGDALGPIGWAHQSLLFQRRTDL